MPSVWITSFGLRRTSDFVHGGFGREVKRRQRARLTGALRVDADRFVAAAGPDFVGIGPVVRRLVQVSRLLGAETDEVPVVDAAAADPDRVAFHPDAVSARSGDAEAAPTEAAGIGEDAGDSADGLALFRFRIRNGLRPARTSG